MLAIGGGLITIRGGLVQGRDLLVRVGAALVGAGDLLVGVGGRLVGVGQRLIRLRLARLGAPARASACPCSAHPVRVDECLARGDARIHDLRRVVGRNAVGRVALHSVAFGAGMPQRLASVGVIPAGRKDEITRASCGFADPDPVDSSIMTTC